MSFASPDKLIWLLVALPIVAFYILKTRLRRRPVSTLLFWDQIFEQKRQRSLWQNIRHWLSLLVQLILVGLLAFALADPLWRSQEDTGQDLILVVDNSASMTALDPESGETRLAEALRQADQVAASLRDGDNIALVTAGNSVRVVVGMSDFAPTVQQAIETIQPTDGPTRIGQAIRAARRLASDPERRRIVVLSDGAVVERQLLDDSDQGQDEAAGANESSTAADGLVGDDVRWIQVGRTLDNVALTTFQVRRSIVDPIGYSLLVEVQNDSEEAVSTRLTLKLDDVLVDVIPLQIEAGGVFRKQIDSTSRAGGVLIGELDHEDALAVDNTAQAILPQRVEVPVKLVTGESQEAYYLTRVFESLPLVRVIPEDDDSTEPKLTVYAGVVPEQLPDGPVLLVDVPEDGPQLAGEDRPAWHLGDRIESPIIAKQEAGSPLLRHVQLQNVVMSGGRDLDVDDNFGTSTVLLETAGGARVCVSVQRDNGRVLLLACDLDSSDLPLRIAFPVLMTNAMNWFFRESGEIRPALATGTTVDVPWDLGSELGVESETESSQLTANLISPRGKISLVTVKQGRVRLGPLATTGIYSLTTEDLSDQLDEEGRFRGPDPGETGNSTAMTEQEVQQQVINGGKELENGLLVAVNVADSNESDLRLPEIAASTAGPLPPGGRPPWFYLVLLAAAIVLIEWVLYQRRVVA